MTAEPGSPSRLLVGRVRERAALTEALARAERGEQAFVTLVGEPGIGKTALADEFAREARGRGITVVRGVADDVDRSLLSVWRGPMVALRTVRAALDDGKDRHLAAGDGRWEVLGALADALDAAAPVAVVLEDVHWADDTSHWVLSQLGGTLTRGVALVVTSRTVETRHARAPSSQQFVLAGLSADEVVELSRSSGHLEDIDASGLRQRTGGNPLFVLEVLSSPSSAGQLPGRIEVALGHTLDRLSSAAQRALTALSLGGSTTPMALLARALGIAPTELRGRCDEAVAIGVLTSESLASVEFRHALLGETLVARTPADERRRLHAQLAEAWASEHVPEAAARSAVHLLAAVPSVPAVDAAEGALAAGRDLLVADPASARALLADAVDVIDQYEPSARVLLARLLLELGNALLGVFELTEAAAAFRRAADLAGTLDDAELHARAEIAADQHLVIFGDDPRRRQRLADVEARLAAGDHPLRAMVLSRLAVAEFGRADLWPSSRQHAADAEAMARRLGDPGLLATTMTDRFLVARNRDDLHGRSNAADELLALGEAAGRPDRVLIAHEWRYSAFVQLGDLDGGRSVLDDMEVLAALMPSPAWMYGVLLRRALLAAVDGERDLAIDLIEQARPLGVRAVWSSEAFGLELGARTLTARITGVFDPSIGPMQDRVDELKELPPVAFFDVHSAGSHLAAGHEEQAVSLVTKWAERACRAEVFAEAPSTTILLGALVAELGLEQYVDGLRRMIEPFTGYVTTEAGFAIDQPTDMVLAHLALVAHDLDAAMRHVDDVLALARSMGSPPFEARSLWLRARILRAAGDDEAASSDLRDARTAAARCGAVLPTDSAIANVAAGRASIERTDDGWRIRSPHGDGVVAHSNGMAQLASLLGAAPREVLAVDLAGPHEAPVANSLGPALDTAAKKAYRKRIAELQSDIDEADEFADLERASRARLELEALMHELRRAVGMHGRDRPTASGAERARVNVARSLRRAISTVRAAIPALGAHLDVSIRTGRHCCYAPEPAACLEWDVSTKPVT